jgi:ATP-dependent helicase/nuclease subunit B
LPLARRGFARAAGWQPRIETTKTLAASLGPATRALTGQISFDAAVDRLYAAALLRDQPWGEAWARRDARGFEQAAAALTVTAHALADAAFALAPSARAAHWDAARAALAPMAGPGATERLLARAALEWASVAPVPPSDRLFTMAAPSGWIVVQAGGADGLTESLLAESLAPALVVDTDTVDRDELAGIVPHRAPAFALCDDFEHEAQCAAAQVLDHVRRGEVPVALIAQDRVLVRRIRALLERQQAALLDETGWKLSTTRAAAQVMALLVAARADATTDALLDWLHAGATWAPLDAGALADLESACRRGQVGRVAALPATDLSPAAARLWVMAAGVLASLATTRRKALGAWLRALQQALDRSGTWSVFQADDAGRQVLAALRLAPRDRLESAWTLGASQVVMSFDAFRDWVDGAPRITLMRRRMDGSDPLGDSALVERLALALAERGAVLAPWQDPCVDMTVVATPIRRSAPAAFGLLPMRLSASACEALRACPYRFFALHLLRLREDNELERELEKRDYGTWIHAVLYDFHATRDAPASADAEVARLMQLAPARRIAQGIADADFLPFAASFAAFAPRYIAWLHRRDGEGANWQRGEADLSISPAELDGIEMRGVIDRIDDVCVAGNAALQLIDYKTGGGLD